MCLFSFTASVRQIQGKTAHLHPLPLNNYHALSPAHGCVTCASRTNIISRSHIKIIMLANGLFSVTALQGNLAAFDITASSKSGALAPILWCGYPKSHLFLSGKGHSYPLPHTYTHARTHTPSYYYAGFSPEK